MIDYSYLSGEEFPYAGDPVFRKYGIDRTAVKECVNDFFFRAGPYGTLYLEIPVYGIKVPVGFWEISGSSEGYHRLLLFDEVIARTLILFSNPYRAAAPDWADPNWKKKEGSSNGLWQTEKLQES